MRRGKSGWGVAAAIVLILVVVWVALRGDDPDVIVFGDSLSFQATPEIEQQFVDAGKVDGTVVAKPGARIGDGVEWVADRVGGLREPKVIVIALGTNDAVLDPPEFEQQWPEITGAVDDLLGEASDAPCVVWVAPDLAGGSDQARRIVDHVRTTSPDVRILDWPAIVGATPGVYVDDGVHHTDGGQQRFAEAIVRTGVLELCGFEP